MYEIYTDKLFDLADIILSNIVCSAVNPKKTPDGINVITLWASILERRAKNQKSDGKG